MADRLMVDVGGQEQVSALAYAADGTGGPPRVGATFVLAHGAGAGQSSPFMVRLAAGLASRGLDVLTFNFAYTEHRRRAPDRAEKLEACYRAVVAATGRHPPFAANAVVIGGKSMGGRIASHLAAAEGGPAPDIRGLVFLGYPLHPPGKPEQLRSAHLSRIRAPMLFIQGSRDPFGTPAELAPILDGLDVEATLHVVEQGNHSLATPKRAAVSPEQVFEGVQDTIVQWIRRAIAAPRVG